MDENDYKIFLSKIVFIITVAVQMSVIVVQNF